MDNQFEFSKLGPTVKNEQQQVYEIAKANAEYKAEQDAAVFETRDLLRQMQEESAKESQLNTRRFVIQTVVSVAALIAALIAAVATVIPLLWNLW